MCSGCIDPILAPPLDGFTLNSFTAPPLNYMKKKVNMHDSFDKHNPKFFVESQLDSFHNDHGGDKENNSQSINLANNLFPFAYMPPAEAPHREYCHERKRSQTIPMYSGSDSISPGKFEKPYGPLSTQSATIQEKDETKTLKIQPQHVLLLDDDAHNIASAVSGGFQTCKFVAEAPEKTFETLFHHFLGHDHPLMSNFVMP